MNISRWSAACLLIAALTPTVFAQPFKEMVIFGDSGTDTGNFHAEFGLPVSPPYFDGRFSNGPVWVEHLAARMGLPNPVASELGGTNYAWAGASTGTRSFGAPFGAIADTDEQIATYLETHTPGSDQLFVLWAGENDFNLGQVDANAPAKLLTDQLSLLTDKGARHFLVLNLATTLVLPNLADVSSRFNQSLSEILGDIKSNNDAITITEFDVDGLFTAVTSNPPVFGFVDAVSSACLDCGFGTRSNPTQVQDTPEDFLFWDDGHLSARAHQIHGDAVFNRLVMSNGDLNQNGVLDAGDIDLLSSVIQSGKNDVTVEMDGNWILNASDHAFWVHDLASTYFGDANLDGEFDTTDLVIVLAAGEYEDDIELNSTWATGDWNADGEFNTTDLVVALADGGYEAGPRPAAVPEPSSLLLAIIGMMGASFSRQPS